MNLHNKQHPTYNPDKWNNDEYIRKTHNCYAYALNEIYKEYAIVCKNI